MAARRCLAALLVAQCALGLQPLRKAVSPAKVPLLNVAEALARKGVASLGAAAICFSTFSVGAPAYAAQDMSNVGRCVINKCSLELAKCITNPKCAANLICINTCAGKADETECQIRCGDLFDNAAIGEFNACAVSQKSCVPQRNNPRADDGAFPIPPDSALVKTFDTKSMDGRWFISAGLNPIFDTFDCQVHYFNAPAPGKLYGKLNWRIAEPDGEFFNKQAVQEFIQDPKNPAVLYNHDNEYLHYQDDWYILDAETAPKDEADAFILVYYRGKNDAWDGYGGAVLYTRARVASQSVTDRAAAATQRAGIDFRSFQRADNTCSELKDSQRTAMREKYAKSVLLTAEKELQEEATNLRNSASTIVSKDYRNDPKGAGDVERATGALEKYVADFERTVADDAVKLEKLLEADIVAAEKELLREEQLLFGKKP